MRRDLPKVLRKSIGHGTRCTNAARDIVGPLKMFGASLDGPIKSLQKSSRIRLVEVVLLLLRKSMPLSPPFVCLMFQVLIVFSLEPAGRDDRVRVSSGKIVKS